MSEEETPPTEKESEIGAVKAYEILKQRQINEDRILAERTSMFLLATAFLFVAFVMLLDPEWTTSCIVKTLRIILPSVGIILTILLYIFNRGAVKALTFWHDSQCKIERETPEFAYMREHNITPHLERFESEQAEKGEETPEDKNSDEPSKHKKRTSGTRPIYKCWLPLTFFVLWGFSLVLVIRSYF